MHTINLPENQNITLMFSGGADSSILLYLLHKHNIEENKKCVIQSYTVPRRTGARDHTANVINYIRTYLKTEVLDTICIGDPDVHHTLFARNAIKEILAMNKYALLFTGDTQNPDEILDTTFVPPKRGKDSNPIILQPFLLFDKSYVLSLYFKHGVEDMLKATHSCSVETFGRCKYCFFCKEREWAFSKLGLVDPGTN
jgi:7-cyano-7-deazaguanine synthase in queuosine biosynthesis